MLKNFTVFLISNDNFFWGRRCWVLEIIIMDYHPQNSNQSSNLIRKNKKKSGQFPTVLLSYIYKVQNT